MLTIIYSFLLYGYANHHRLLHVIMWYCIYGIEYANRYLPHIIMCTIIQVATASKAESPHALQTRPSGRAQALPCSCWAGVSPYSQCYIDTTTHSG